MNMHVFPQVLEASVAAPLDEWAAASERLAQQVHRRSTPMLSR